MDRSCHTEKSTHLLEITIHVSLPKVFLTLNPIIYTLYLIDTSFTYSLGRWQSLSKYIYTLLN